MLDWIKSIFKGKKKDKNFIRFHLKNGKTIDIFYVDPRKKT